MIAIQIKAFKLGNFIQAGDWAGERVVVEAEPIQFCHFLERGDGAIQIIAIQIQFYKLWNLI